MGLFTGLLHLASTPLTGVASVAVSGAKVVVKTATGDLDDASEELFNAPEKAARRMIQSLDTAERKLRE